MRSRDREELCMDLEDEGKGNVMPRGKSREETEVKIRG